MFKIIVGIPLIAIGLHFTEVVPGTKHPFVQFPELGDWELELLPNWRILEPYQNLWDGVRGDKRGWYAKEHGQSYWQKLWWTAIRNPTNFESRVTNSIDILQYTTRVAEGYKEYVDEDSNTWGESLIIGTHNRTGEIVTARTKMKKLVFGYYALWREGYKFSYGEERQDFGPLGLTKNYEGIKALAIMYAKEGYRVGNAMKALNRLAGKTNRGFFPTIKKIKD